MSDFYFLIPRNWKPQYSPFQLFLKVTVLKKLILKYLASYKSKGVVGPKAPSVPYTFEQSAWGAKLPLPISTIHIMCQRHRTSSGY